MECGPTQGELVGGKKCKECETNDIVLLQNPPKDSMKLVTFLVEPSLFLSTTSAVHTKF